MVDLEVSLNLGPIDEWTAELEKELLLALRKTLFYGERQSKLRVPVDTGFLRNSIYVVAQGANTYGLVAAASKKRGQTSVLPAEPPRDKYEGILAAGAEYAADVEYGHFAKRSTTRMSTRGKSAKGNDRLTAQRIQDRAFGTFVQGVFFFARTVPEMEIYFMNAAQEAVKKAGRKLQ